MASIVLITGGSRSGKSAFARKLAEGTPGRRGFVATCPPVDDEMRQRIDRHRNERVDAGWETIEETTDLAGVLGRTADFGVLLVDCLTLWVNNLMYEKEKEEAQLSEDDIAAACGSVLDACRGRPGRVVFVTNEVGMGIVPEHPVARRFRDLAGRCNQILASAADEVHLMVSGLSVRLR